jgi:DNA-directed RNA polymerase I, II, and III subunit RPABC5
MLAEGVPSGEALDLLGLKRWCCRRIILGHVELIDKLLKYSREEKADKECDPSTQIE